MSRQGEKAVKKRKKSLKMSLFLRFFGYYSIEISRAHLEDFLNLCLRYGFGYWGIESDADGRAARINISALELANIKAACKVWQIRIKVISINGLPKRLLKYKGRWGLAVGAILAALVFFSAQSVVWRIDVTGNERLTKVQVLESLAQNGLCVGSRISKLKPNSIENRVMINNEDIAWISVKIVGTVAKIEVLEVIDTEIEAKNTAPANLVSAFDAQIVGMEVYSGFLAVKEGDYVREGELLVSGIYKEGKAPLRFSRASGRILGKVSRSFEVEIPLFQQKKVLTGRKKEKKTLIFFGKSIKFFANYRNLPSTYDIINYVYTFNPFSLGELPISVCTDEYLEYEIREFEISEDEAIEQAHAELRNRIDNELPDAQILKKSLYGEFVDGKYVLKCTVTAICNITRQVDFEVEGLLPSN